MKNVKLQNLRFFVAVYEERSISAAARKVHATQSGVSTQVRDLETQLGLSLFDRVSTGVVPTKAGEQIYRRAIVILREVGRLDDDITAFSGELTGEVRVGIMPTFARAILGPVLARFATDNQLVDVKVTEGYSALLMQMVLDGDLDLAIVPDGVIPEALRSSHLDTDLELLVSARPIEGVKHSVDLASVPSLRLVLPGPGNARRKKIDQQLQNYSPAVHNIMELDSMMTTLDMVRRGGWASILPGCLCLPDFDDPEIYHYSIERPKMTVSYLLVEPAAKETSLAVKQFTTSLSDEIRQSCEACRTHFNHG